MRKWILPLVFLFVFATIFVYVMYNGSNNDSIKSTNNIADYHTDEYFIPSTVFPETIPENAQVVAFSHTVFWSTAEDIYLELKFNTQEEMQAYLEQIKGKSMPKNQGGQWPKPSEKFIQTPNAYDSNYVDLFSTMQLAWKSNEFFTGYQISITDETTVFDCDVDLISYRLDDLTVIHTYIKGVFTKSVHDYVPMYFKRFSVPIDQNHNRFYYLQGDGSFLLAGTTSISDD